MKKIVALTLAALALAIPATQASAAKQAGPTAAQFRALQKQVTGLQKQVKTLNSVIASCLFVQAVPVAQYGANDGTQGYLYNLPSGTTVATTALDVVAQGDTPQAWFVGTSNDCATAMNSGGAFTSFKVDPGARSVAAVHGKRDRAGRGCPLDSAARVLSPRPDHLLPLDSGPRS